MISEVKRIKDKLKAVKDQDAKMDHSLNNQDKKVSLSKFYFFLYIFIQFWKSIEEICAANLQILY